ncbi:MAG: hypothetical protein WAS36_04840 [Candidatus Saccharimonadales bacterium]
MSGLEQSFYIIAMIFMAISLLLILKLLKAVTALSSDVTTIQRTLDKRLSVASHAPNIVSEIASVVRDIAKAVK